MCCLCPPFDGKSIHELALKIVRANFEEIPRHYSTEINELIDGLLNPNPEERPNINRILKHRLIAPLVKEFLSDEDFISEFSHTVLHNKNVFSMTKTMLEKSRRAEADSDEGSYKPSKQSNLQNPKDLIDEVVKGIPFTKDITLSKNKKPASPDSRVRWSAKKREINISPKKPKSKRAANPKRIKSKTGLKEEIAARRREQILIEVQKKREADEEILRHRLRSSERKQKLIESKKAQNQSKRDEHRRKMIADRKRMKSKSRAGVQF